MSENEIKRNELYKMDLHDQLHTSIDGKAVEILRVPGGWLYSSYAYGQSYQETFVPFDNEFMEEKE